MSEFMCGDCGSAWRSGSVETHHPDCPKIVGRGASRDAEIAALRSQLDAVTRERIELTKDKDTLMSALEYAKADLATRDAACAAMREAMEEIAKGYSINSSNPAVRLSNRARAALSDPHGTVFLERLKLAEAVCEAYLTWNPDVMTDEIKGDLGRRAAAFHDALSSWRKFEDGLGNVAFTK